MSNTTLLYCATDKEIFDVLMSAKRRMNSSFLRSLAKDSGIFYSPKDSREMLASNLSLLPHDFYNLNVILDQRESSSRAEKITSLTLNETLDIDDIKEVTSEYKEQVPADEKIISHQNGASNYAMNVQYSEIDYSKTRLVQRRPKEANIEFIVENEKTIIRLPANDKAKGVVKNLIEKLDAKKKTQINVAVVDLSEFNTLESRTSFFTSLISKLPDFTLENVTSLKVESSALTVEDNDFDIEDDQDVEQAKQEMLSLVKNVALRGESLLASNEYKQLKDNGFFITSIIWRSQQQKSPHSIIEFEAGFEEPEEGKGFKYAVRGAYNFTGKKHTKTLRPMSDEAKQVYLSTIEHTAQLVIDELRETEESTSANNTNELVQD